MKQFIRILLQLNKIENKENENEKEKEKEKEKKNNNVIPVKLDNKQRKRQ